MWYVELLRRELTKLHFYEGEMMEDKNGNDLVHGIPIPLHIRTENSNRNLEFYRFSLIVREHIESYTIPQYGDSPSDEVESWTPEMCVAAMQKYTKRFESARRGRVETLRDMAKIAHFAAIAFFKMMPTQEEIRIIEEGRS
jgi:hypothetical protein